ncbi:radical SAM/SPASM domain-containing protein [Desulforamulus aeronauticus]|uniref:Radical SAM additional 4Fe4S-binding SPASM domain-containing protein n=1 Tax=Desulforamulus aeronauticus DSM 10349 TaxID=1121421 RepID=A0A1M6NVB7_9FIRM|nr:radical SAM protein [Desulforamulus aeronauticus]SHJ99687.1 radical SAM additional 4Fe4S-binding SPASM domain-containing protein [Desulforamulus aeronauticus DSM 10349]
MTDEVQAPLRSMRAPEMINIQLTTRCPLRCPQCYCDFHQGKDIKPELALKYIDQAAALKIPLISLSGGETLVYPYLEELLQAIHAKGIKSAIAISGWGVDTVKLQTLKSAGVGEIYVSLNGSSPEINDKSRQGYALAINALRLLQQDGQADYYINWVARNDNVPDFPNLVELAQSMGVRGVVIVESKPDAAYELPASLSRENFILLADYLKKHHQQDIPVAIEPCFSPLRAFIQQHFLWNGNTGFDKGCGAGRSSMAVDVDGNLIPCRHLLYPESYELIADYWQHSEVLDKLRRFEDNKGEPCRSCTLGKYCLSCRAVADKVEKNLFSGNHYCQAGAVAR